MVSKEFLIVLNRMNSLLPEKVYWVYDDTEIIEISTDTEASIELTSGVHFDAKDIDIERVKLSNEISQISLVVRIFSVIASATRITDI